MLPKWASTQKEIHRAASCAETCCQGLFIQSNALAAGWLFCQHFTLLTLRLLKSGLAPFFISILTSLSVPLSLLPTPGVSMLRFSCWKALSGSLVADQSSILMMAMNIWWAGGRLGFSLLDEKSLLYPSNWRRFLSPPSNWGCGEFCPLSRSGGSLWETWGLYDVYGQWKKKS